MDTTQLAQMVNWLDEQHRRDRTELSRLQQRIEAQTNEIQEQGRHIKELEARLTGAQTQLGRFDQMDQALQNLKTELSILVNNQADELSKTQRDLERARMTDREALSRSITEVRKELPRIRVVEEEMAVRKAEDQRLSETLISLRQGVADMNKDIDERTRGLPYMVEQRNSDNKRIAQLQQENVELFKRVEEASSKLQMLEQKHQKTEAQVRALPPMVDDMKRGQEQFIDSLKLADADRQRQMKDWQQTFKEQADVVDEQRKRILEFAATNDEARRAIEALDAFRQRLQREQNQVAELQRLAEERQRKEMSAFQADNAKQWKKQTLEWDFRWEQQTKVNATVREQFPALTAQLKLHGELLEHLWRGLEAQGAAELKAAQTWLGDIQKLAEQRQGIVKAGEEG